MKWLVSFLLGAVVGAGGLFVYLREIADAPDPIITEAAARPAPVAPGSAAGGVRQCHPERAFGCGPADPSGLPRNERDAIGARADGRRQRCRPSCWCRSRAFPTAS
jgi:hypothetical protein